MCARTGLTTQFLPALIKNTFYECQRRKRRSNLTERGEEGKGRGEIKKKGERTLGIKERDEDQLFFFLKKGGDRERDEGGERKSIT